MYAALAHITQFNVTDYKDGKNVPYCKATDFMLKGEGEYSVDSPRKLLAELREQGYLSEYSKGKVAVRDHGDHVIIIDKNKGHPLFILFHRDTSPTNTLPLHDKSLAMIINEELRNVAAQLHIDMDDEQYLNEQL